MSGVVPIIINDYKAFEGGSAITSLEKRSDIPFFQGLLDTLSTHSEDVIKQHPAMDNNNYDEYFKFVTESKIKSVYLPRLAGNRLYASSFMSSTNEVVDKFLECLNGSTMFPAVIPSKLMKDGFTNDGDRVDVFNLRSKKNKSVYRMYNIPKEQGNPMIIPFKYLSSESLDESIDLDNESCNFRMNDFISTLCLQVFELLKNLSMDDTPSEEVMNAVASSFFTAHVSLTCNEFQNDPNSFYSSDYTSLSDSDTKVTVPYTKLQYNPDTHSVSYISLSFLPLNSKNNELYDNHLKITFHLQRKFSNKQRRVNVAEYIPKMLLTQKILDVCNLGVPSALANRIGRRKSKNDLGSKTPRVIPPVKINIREKVNLKKAQSIDIDSIIDVVTEDISVTSEQV